MLQHLSFSRNNRPILELEILPLERSWDLQMMGRSIDWVCHDDLNGDE
ncbi:MAG: hypothetical protein NT070_11515 [Cyanobacteria bacterium]|nr:hypothetical protein [Cyanobacteriota bacterium]